MYEAAKAIMEASGRARGPSALRAAYAQAIQTWEPPHPEAELLARQSSRRQRPRRKAS